jgi:predicted secreted protein
MRGFKVALLVLLALPIVCLAAANASAATESGYLSGAGASYTFTVNAGSVNYVEVTFSWPKGSADFWVKVIGQDGRTVLGNFDLDNGEIIQLSGGGTFYLTVYSNRGAGYWSASYPLSGGGGPGPSSGSCNIYANSANGYLVGPGDSCNWSIYANSNYVEVPFNYPKGSADFWVKVIGQDGRTVLGNFDLDNGSVIQLSGGGTFYLTIYSNRGTGNWSCSW